MSETLYARQDNPRLKPWLTKLILILIAFVAGRAAIDELKNHISPTPNNMGLTSTGGVPFVTPLPPVEGIGIVNDLSNPNEWVEGIDADPREPSYQREGFDLSAPAQTYVESFPVEAQSPVLILAALTGHQQSIENILQRDPGRFQSELTNLNLRMVLARTYNPEEREKRIMAGLNASEDISLAVPAVVIPKEGRVIFGKNWYDTHIDVIGASGIKVSDYIQDSNSFVSTVAIVFKDAPDTVVLLADTNFENLPSETISTLDDQGYAIMTYDLDWVIPNSDNPDGFAKSAISSISRGFGR